MATFAWQKAESTNVDPSPPSSPRAHSSTPSAPAGAWPSSARASLHLQIPGWFGLLTELALKVKAPHDKARIQAWLEPGAAGLTARDFEGLGEELHAALGSEFRTHLRQALARTPKAKHRAAQAAPLHPIPLRPHDKLDDLLGTASIPGTGALADTLHRGDP